MGGVIIGKHTLESLTSGMYSDPYVVFREYIQNSADAIDAAVSGGILPAGGGLIHITLAPGEGRLSFSDNGTGIPASQAESTLISIGNSKKSARTDRGFRGIGRLAALSCCSRLTFETSYPGEPVRTRLAISGAELAARLSYGTAEDAAAADVLQRIYTVETSPERAEAHYFRVELEGVDQAAGLFRLEDVTDYIAQTAPVPYDPAFTWGREIEARLQNVGCPVRHFEVRLTFGPKTYSIYKPYRDTFLADRGKNLTDRIPDIDLITLTGADGSPSAVGWVAQTGYLGRIPDKSIRGLRLRKGNILIGDGQTLNAVFKDPRFNGWSIGEFFVVDPLLIPNARRDNFERNQAFLLLLEQLRGVAAGITKQLRGASLRRNAQLSAALDQTEQAVKAAAAALESGLTSGQKGPLARQLTDARQLVGQAPIRSGADASCQEIAFEELDLLLGTLRGATSYKAINALNHLSHTEKRTLERVFNAIFSTGSESANTMVDAILAAFAP